MAHNIVMLMQADSTYKNCKITRYETNSRLNARSALCRKMPDKFLKKNTAATCRRAEIAADGSPKNTQSPVPEVHVGMSVVHKTFGNGKIVKTDDRGSITVAFDGGEKELSLSCCLTKGLLEVE